MRGEGPARVGGEATGPGIARRLRPQAEGGRGGGIEENGRGGGGRDLTGRGKIARVVESRKLEGREQTEERRGWRKSADTKARKERRRDQRRQA